MASEIAADINKERATRGLKKVPFDSGYSAGAQRVAERNRDQPCHACHSTDHPSGEVVWWGSNYPSSASTIWWMGSPPHRALLLAPTATRLGVGVACNGTEHDAVAWIETPAGAQDPPAEPVATKSGTGSRCTGAPISRTSQGSSPPTTRASTVTTSAGSATQLATTTTGGSTRASSSTTRSTLAEVAATVPEARGPTSPFQSPLASGGAPTPETGNVASARTVAMSRGVGPAGTLLLLGIFASALAVGRATRRYR